MSPIDCACDARISGQLLCSVLSQLIILCSRGFQRINGEFGDVSVFTFLSASKLVYVDPAARRPRLVLGLDE